MKTRMTLFIALAAAVLLSGCAAGLHATHLRTANFASYDTFYWLPTRTPTVITNPIIDSGILTERVRSAVVETLTSHGYRRVDNLETADFVVTYGVTTEQKLRGTRFGAGFGFTTYPFYPSIYYSGFYFPFYPAQYNFEIYQQAHLVINIMDGATHQLVWRGWNTMLLTPENFSRESIFNIVHKILTRFPPPQSAAA